MGLTRDLQWVCARLCNGSRDCACGKFTQGAGVFITLWCKVFPYKFISHKIQADLQLVSNGA